MFEDSLQFARQLVERDGQTLLSRRLDRRTSQDVSRAGGNPKKGWVDGISGFVDKGGSLSHVMYVYVSEVPFFFSSFFFSLFFLLFLFLGWALGKKGSNWQSGLPAKIRLLFLTA